MKKHGLIDANDMGPPPTKADQIEQNRKDEANAAQFDVPKHVMAEMKRQGLDSIVD